MNHECSCYCFFIADCHLNPDSNENSTDPDPIIDFYARETYHQKVLQDNCKTFLFLKTWFFMCSFLRTTFLEPKINL